MQVTYFDIRHPVVAANQGFFTAGDNWRHKRIYQNEAYEIIIVVSGQLFLQVNKHRFAITANEALLVPAHAIVVSYQKSPRHTQYYWFHFFPHPTVAKWVNIGKGSQSATELFPYQPTLPCQPLRSPLCSLTRS